MDLVFLLKLVKNVTGCLLYILFHLSALLSRKTLTLFRKTSLRFTDLKE